MQNIKHIAVHGTFDIKTLLSSNKSAGWYGSLTVLRAVGVSSVHPQWRPPDGANIGPKEMKKTLLFLIYKAQICIKNMRGV